VEDVEVHIMSRTNVHDSRWAAAVAIAAADVVFEDGNVHNNFHVIRSGTTMESSSCRGAT
jgi:hypothetical protein